MYIYNVTTNVSEAVHDKWLQWMKAKHIPDMLNTGKFSKAKISQVMIEEEMGGTTYAVQYTADSIEVLGEYYKNNAPKFRDEAMSLFKDQIVSFRTELKVINEQFSVIAKN